MNFVYYWIVILYRCYLIIHAVAHFNFEIFVALIPADNTAAIDRAIGFAVVDQVAHAIAERSFPVIEKYYAFSYQSYFAIPGIHISKSRRPATVRAMDFSCRPRLAPPFGY